MEDGLDADPHRAAFEQLAGTIVPGRGRQHRVAPIEDGRRMLVVQLRATDATAGCGEFLCQVLDLEGQKALLERLHARDATPFAQPLLPPYSEAEVLAFEAAAGALPPLLRHYLTRVSRESCCDTRRLTFDLGWRPQPGQARVVLFATDAGPSHFTPVALGGGEAPVPPDMPLPPPLPPLHEVLFHPMACSRRDGPVDVDVLEVDLLPAGRGEPDAERVSCLLRLQPDSDRFAGHAALAVDDRRGAVVRLRWAGLLDADWPVIVPGDDAPVPPGGVAEVAKEVPVRERGPAGEMITTTATFEFARSAPRLAGCQCDLALLAVRIPELARLVREAPKLLVTLSSTDRDGAPLRNGDDPERVFVATTADAFHGDQTIACPIGGTFAVHLQWGGLLDVALPVTLTHRGHERARRREHLHAFCIGDAAVPRCDGTLHFAVVKGTVHLTRVASPRLVLLITEAMRQCAAHGSGNHTHAFVPKGLRATRPHRVKTDGHDLGA